MFDGMFGKRHYLVAMMTSTPVQGEAYWCCPFLHGNFVAHAFVSVESRCVVCCCCCCCWAYLLIIVVSFGTIFCIVFFFFVQECVYSPARHFLHSVTDCLYAVSYCSEHFLTTVVSDASSVCLKHVILKCEGSFKVFLYSQCAVLLGSLKAFMHVNDAKLCTSAPRVWRGEFLQSLAACDMACQT